MKAKSIVYFFIALNAAAYILGALMVGANGQPATLINLGQTQLGTDTPQQIAEQHFSLFNFSAQSVTAGLIGAGIIGLIGWVTKQGVYALYAAVIWIIGIFFNIFQYVLTGFSSLVTTLIPSDVAFVGGIIYGFIMIAFFYALAGTIGQRPDWG